MAAREKRTATLVKYILSLVVDVGVLTKGIGELYNIYSFKVIDRQRVNGTALLWNEGNGYY